MATKGTVLATEWSDETGVRTETLTACRGNSRRLCFTNPGWYAGGSKLLFGCDRDRTGYGNVYLAELPACDSLPDIGDKQ